MSSRSYVCGYSVTTADLILFGLLNTKKKFNKFIHIERWYNHINSYSAKEINCFPPFDLDKMKPLLDHVLEIQVNNFALFFFSSAELVIHRKMFRHSLCSIYCLFRPVGISKRGFINSSKLYKEKPQVSDSHGLPN